MILALCNAVARRLRASAPRPADGFGSLQYLRSSGDIIGTGPQVSLGANYHTVIPKGQSMQDMDEYLGGQQSERQVLCLGEE